MITPMGDKKTDQSGPKSFSFGTTSTTFPLASQTPPAPERATPTTPVHVPTSLLSTPMQQAPHAAAQMSTQAAYNMAVDSAAGDEALDRLERKLDNEIAGIKGHIQRMDMAIEGLSEQIKTALQPPEWEVMGAAQADRPDDVEMRPGWQGWIVTRKSEFDPWQCCRATITGVADPDKWIGFTWDGDVPVPNVSVKGTKSAFFTEVGAKNTAS